MSNKSKSILDLFLESAVGFDYIGESLKNAPTYLPYNITSTDGGYTIEMAVAGYGTKDISVEVKDGSLSIKGKKSKEEDTEASEFLYRGLGFRNFQKYFSIVAGVVVTDATIKDGILKINLEKESSLPTKIEVGEG